MDDLKRKSSALSGAMKLKEGEKAVYFSKKLEKDKYANSLAQKDASDEQTARIIRRVGTRTFYRIGDTWIDSAYEHKKDEKKIVEVEYLSKAYFELAAHSKPIARCLALGERVIVKLGEKVYRISPVEKKGEK